MTSNFLDTLQGGEEGEERGGKAYFLDLLTYLGSYSVAERLHNQAVIVEDLGVKKLLEKGNLSRQIADAAWRRFISFLEYKAKWYMDGY